VCERMMVRETVFGRRLKENKVLLSLVIATNDQRANQGIGIKELELRNWN